MAFRRRGSIKKRRKRKPGEWERIYGSEERVAWVKTLPCLCCDREGTPADPIVNAHTKVDGTSRKAGYRWIVPLLDSHHKKQGQNGWSAIGLTREVAQKYAGYVEELWQEHCEMTNAK